MTGTLPPEEHVTMNVYDFIKCHPAIAHLPNISRVRLAISSQLHNHPRANPRSIGSPVWRMCSWSIFRYYRWCYSNSFLLRNKNIYLELQNCHTSWLLAGPLHYRLAYYCRCTSIPTLTPSISRKNLNGTDGQGSKNMLLKQTYVNKWVYGSLDTYSMCVKPTGAVHHLFGAFLLICVAWHVK